MNNAFGQFNKEALEVLDFARCQRPDGSYYGTGGQCRKGVSVGPKEKAALKKAAAGGSKRAQKALDKLEGGSAPKKSKNEVSTKDLKEFAGSISGRGQGDGMFWDEGGNPEVAPAKMSQKEMEGHVKEAFREATGPDSSAMEYALENLQESNPKLASKIKSISKENGIPVTSVTAEKYYTDGDKELHPGIRGKINGVPYDMPNLGGTYKSEDPELGFFLG